MPCTHASQASLCGWRRRSRVPLHHQEGPRPAATPLLVASPPKLRSLMTTPVRAAARPAACGCTRAAHSTAHDHDCSGKFFSLALVVRLCWPPLQALRLALRRPSALIGDLRTLGCACLAPVGRPGTGDLSLNTDWLPRKAWPDLDTPGQWQGMIRTSRRHRNSASH